MAEKQMMYIGQRIKSLREASGMKQKDLEKETGIPIASLSNYEKDKNEPSLMNAMKIASALGVSIDYLVSGDKEPIDKIIEKKTGLTPDAVRIIRRLNNVDMDYADILCQLIKTQEFIDAIIELGTAKQIIVEDANQPPEELVSFIRTLNILHKSHGGSNDAMQNNVRDLADFHAYEAKDKMRQAVDAIMREE